MSAVVEQLPVGSALLANQDRWADARALNVGSLRLQRLGRAPAQKELVHGWFVRRQGRAQALFRWDDRLKYLCGRSLWDVEEARVRRRAVGPLRSLTFEGEGGAVGACRWLDWELARRWFIPKWVDFTRYEDDSEHFDWSLFVEAVLSTDRRHRIGRPID
jgi:hypothetical protein